MGLGQLTRRRWQEGRLERERRSEVERRLREVFCQSWIFQSFVVSDSAISDEAYMRSGAQTCLEGDVAQSEEALCLAQARLVALHFGKQRPSRIKHLPRRVEVVLGRLVNVICSGRLGAICPFSRSQAGARAGGNRLLLCEMDVCRERRSLAGDCREVTEGLGQRAVCRSVARMAGSHVHVPHRAARSRAR